MVELFELTLREENIITKHKQNTKNYFNDVINLNGIIRL